VPALDLRPAVLARKEADVVPGLSLRERDVRHDSHNIWVESERVEDVAPMLWLALEQLERDRVLQGAHICTIWVGVLVLAAFPGWGP